MERPGRLSVRRWRRTESITRISCSAERTAKSTSFHSKRSRKLLKRTTTRLQNPLIRRSTRNCRDTKTTKDFYTNCSWMTMARTMESLPSKVKKQVRNSFRVSLSISLMNSLEMKEILTILLSRVMQSLFRSLRRSKNRLNTSSNYMTTSKRSRRKRTRTNVSLRKSRNWKKKLALTNKNDHPNDTTQLSIRSINSDLMMYLLYFNFFKRHFLNYHNI